MNNNTDIMGSINDEITWDREHELRKIMLEPVNDVITAEQFAEVKRDIERPSLLLGWNGGYPWAFYPASEDGEILGIGPVCVDCFDRGDWASYDDASAMRPESTMDYDASESALVCEDCGDCIVSGWFDDLGIKYAEAYDRGEDFLIEGTRLDNVTYVDRVFRRFGVQVSAGGCLADTDDRGYESLADAVRMRNEYMSSYFGDDETIANTPDEWLDTVGIRRNANHAGMNIEIFAYDMREPEMWEDGESWDGPCAPRDSVVDFLSQEAYEFVSEEYANAYREYNNLHNAATWSDDMFTWDRDRWASAIEMAREKLVNAVILCRFFNEYGRTPRLGEDDDRLDEILSGDFAPVPDAAGYLEPLMDAAKNMVAAARVARSLR